MTATLNRLAWSARRQSGSNAPRRRWLKSEVAQLESFVGHLRPVDMAARLDRPFSSIISKLQRLGYRTTRDVMTPLGINAVGLARRINVPYERVWRDVRSGLIPATRKGGPAAHKDYLITWPDAVAYEKRIEALRAKRQRALDRIQEPTLTKTEFMQLIGLQETHATRYCQFKIVRGWKIPCKWQVTPRQRWEWVVSKADALRVKRLREEGKLRLNTKLYRTNQAKSNQLIAHLRRSRRLGTRPVKIERKAVIEGWLTVAQVARAANVSETVIYTHVKNKRLNSKTVRVGNHNFFAIEPTQLPNYIKWCQRPTKQTGPLHARRSLIEKIHRAGRITIPEAARQFNLKEQSLRCAVCYKHLPSKLFGNTRGLKLADVSTYAATYRPRPSRPATLGSVEGSNGNAQ